MENRQISVGTKVFHNNYGEGIVIFISYNKNTVVNFNKEIRAFYTQSVLNIKSNYVEADDGLFFQCLSSYY